MYPFASLTERAIRLQVDLGRAYKPRLNDLEIVLKEKKLIEDENYQSHSEVKPSIDINKPRSLADEMREYLNKVERRKEIPAVVIPYHYTLAIGITIVFLGIILMALAGKKIKEDYD